jgi:hypothetical protein
MIKILLKQLQSLLTFCLLLISFPFNNMAFSQSLSSESLESLLNTNLELNLPDQGSPPDRENGGKRPGCPTIYDNISLTALIPQTNYGLTTLERPNFYFYVPYSKNDGVSAEFLLKYYTTQSNTINIYQQEIELGNTAGIIKINFPDHIQPLIENGIYDFSLTLTCQGTNEQIWVKSYLQRVTLNSEIQQQLNKTTLGKKLEIYAQQDLWFDLLNSVAQLYYSNPENEIIKNIWQDILQQIELENIEDKPVFF